MRPIFYVACALAVVIGLMMYLGGVAAVWCPLPLAIWLTLVVGASAAGGVGGAGAATTAAAGALAAPAALGLGAAAVGLGTYYAAGENQKVEAQRAQDRSMAAMLGFDNVEAMKFHRSRMDLDVADPTDEQAAITEALLKQMTQLNATLQNQPAAFAEAMGRKTIKVAQAPDPNASGGN